ncbi:uncharacterized protein LOC133322994 [Musca vetustissima]|uniref:uncharacterized protein LOC133322994 n=1 Tax=Musca vetustissima TaxID=27455 RepID=UPI002AB649EA|nr:uncharacterized protein LOC133322994 [Musca vetustissima]
MLESSTICAKNNIQDPIPTDELFSHDIFEVENITVIRPPLLKIFYWQKLDIDGLNEKLSSDVNHIEHSLYLPTRQLNSKPLKIIFWLRNVSRQALTLTLKRLQNCQCSPLETRVGFNQFRYLYHCPHRRLINISQEIFHLGPNDLVAMSMVAHFYLYGSFMLSYEMSCSNSRVIIWNFHLNIVTMDPIESVLTRELLPINVKEYRRMSQAIWIRNITGQNLQFRFRARDRGFCLINSNMIVPRQSVWPLIVDYRPSDFENELSLTMSLNGFNYDIPLSCKGILDDEDCPPESTVPINDYESSDFLYVLYPNKLTFVMEPNEERSQMVVIHNHNQICIAFKWQTYSINGYFILTFEPIQFTLKPHHSKLCVVHCKTYGKPLNFRNIPAVLEIHRILDKPTQIAQQLLTEIESIDDPKWKEDSYLEHVFLHINLKINFVKLQSITIMPKEGKTTPLIVPLNDGNDNMVLPSNSKTTIFEKLFWNYLSRSNHMRNNDKTPQNLSYEDVVNYSTTTQNGRSKSNDNNNTNLYETYILF